MDWFSWISEHPAAAWAALALLLGAAELMSLDLVLAMLAAGATAGAVAALAGLPIGVQVAVAIACSVLMLAVVRPLAKRRLDTGPDLVLGAGKHLGATALVTEAVSDLEPGRIRLAGEVWSAKPYDPTMVIAAGETVEVLEIRGAYAFVHPIARLES